MRPSLLGQRQNTRVNRCFFWIYQSIYVLTTLDTLHTHWFWDARTHTHTHTYTFTINTEGAAQWAWAHCCFNLLRQLSLSELQALAANSIGFLSWSLGLYSGWGWMAAEGGGREQNDKKKIFSSTLFLKWSECEQELEEAESRLVGALSSRGHYVQQIIRVWRGGTRHSTHNLPPPPRHKPDPSSPHWGFSGE